ncbi:MAG: alpha/beta hydrolase [Erysipelotrichaceae bacterium]|nr:alpha/beta hydrolase [Erysipelotrichaceae bacterium]
MTENGAAAVKKNKGKGRKRLVLFLVLALFLGACFYFGSYYRADETALTALKSDDAVQVSRIPQGGYFFDGPCKDTAIIFYPGAKVETSAYAPLMHRIAEERADVFLLDMPLHMAFFGINKADRIRSAYGTYSSWFMAGHSLGAAMAAQYVSEHLDAYDGLIMLAGYPTRNLHADVFSLLNIYGSNDGHTGMLAKNPQYRPQDTTEVVIDGGNHAQFGNYGIQKGDGTSDISALQQQEEAAAAIVSFIASH